ncbi:hypothetical protein BB559_005627 [Furculomyces boomerangus]|uniref:Protein kinase domain-containing protein n=1 Tax=Furculomyces boomerangus TaxID=61424 RepID=A0A2T9Y7L6_9FUNG|nr:hypothetical protein BB559_005627 [Furculomyces boomerangus]
MPLKNHRPMTRSLRKSSMEDEVFATPSIPSNRQRRKAIPRSDPIKNDKISFPRFSLPPLNTEIKPSNEKKNRNSISHDSMLSSTFSEMRNLNVSNFFETPPSTKLVRPNLEAFSTSGLLIKKNQVKESNENKFFTPETPCKRTPLFIGNSFTQSSAPPAFSMGRYTLKQSFENSPLYLGKHRNQSVESLSENKKRYLSSPADKYESSHPSLRIQNKSNHLTLSSGDFDDDFFGRTKTPDLISEFTKPDIQNNSTSGNKGLMSAFIKLDNEARKNFDTFSISEAGTSFSTASTLKTFGFRNESPTRIDKMPYETTELMQCDSGTGHETVAIKQSDSIPLIDIDIPPKSPLGSSSPLITPDERPQMPQIVNGYATNYPHFLNKAYFFSSSATKNYSFLPPLFDHSPVDEAGYLDYYRYHFDELGVIGRGNFSMVLIARNLEEGKTYAMKKSLRPFQGRKDRIRKLKEVEIMWNLSNHPNIAQIQNSWEQFGLLFIQSELCERGNLKDLFSTYFNSSPVPEENIWKIISAISSGLYFMHSHNVVHLDLKPDNVCVTNNGYIKLVDFGHASYLPVVDFDHEGDRVYLAPEILQSGSYDKPADIFSLGLIALEMATNVILPQNGSEWYSLRNNNLRPSGIENAMISSELSSLITSMLDNNPAKRPTSEQIFLHPMCQRVANFPIS